MKTCPKCKIHPVRGKYPYCSECASFYWSVYRKKNIEKLKDRRQRFRAANLEHVRNGRRKSDLKVKYGLTIEEVEARRCAQLNRCGCCGDEIVKRAIVDHCHYSGQVRGILCSRCNLGLGLFLESEQRLDAAKAYIKRFEYLKILF